MPLRYRKVDAGYLVNDNSHYQISLFDQEHEMVETWVGLGRDGAEKGLARVIEALSHYRDSADEIQARVSSMERYISQKEEELRESVSEGVDVTSEEIVGIAARLHEAREDLESLRRGLARARAWEHVATGVQEKTLNLDEPLSEELREIVAEHNRYARTLGHALWVLVFSDPERLNRHEVTVYPVDII